MSPHVFPRTSLGYYLGGCQLHKPPRPSGISGERPVVRHRPNFHHRVGGSRLGPLMLCGRPDSCP